MICSDLTGYQDSSSDNCLKATRSYNLHDYVACGITGEPQQAEDGMGGVIGVAS